jgi:hypothetical protein
MAGMMGKGGAISDKERRFLEETNRRMAPGMRPSGSGATSDMEMRAYENAIRPVVGQGVVSDMEGEMARENIPSNMDMGMDSEMRAEDISDVEKVRMLIDMGLPPADAMEAVAREKEMNQNPVNPEAFSGGAVAPATVENPAGITNVDPSMGGLGALPTPRGAKDMGMPENGMVADLMRRGYTPDMISAMAGGNMPPREDDAMNLERTGPPTITPTR